MLNIAVLVSGGGTNLQALLDAQAAGTLRSGRITLVVSLFEPAMLVVMGGVVLLIVMAILLPILSLNQLVN